MRVTRRKVCRAIPLPNRSSRPTQFLADGDHNPGEYAELVKKAKESFKRGDLFEVVPGQTFLRALRNQAVGNFHSG